MDEFASWFRNAKQIYSVHSLLISPILGTFRFSCLRTSLTVTSTVLYLYHIYWCATMWIRCAKNVFKAHFSTFIHCISTLYTQYSINKNVNFNFDLSNEINKSEKFAILLLISNFRKDDDSNQSEGQTFTNHLWFLLQLIGSRYSRYQWQVASPPRLGRAQLEPGSCIAHNTAPS